MERTETNSEVVELGDALELTNGQQNFGAQDQQQNAYWGTGGISDDD